MIPNEITLKDLWAARKRIAPYITRTPLVFSPVLSSLSGANVYLKLENLQEIGAFKIRGAANKLLQLSREERSRGVSTFSTGNHGLAVAYMAKRLGIPATVCMSAHVPAAKVNSIARWGAKILQDWDSQDSAGEYCMEAERRGGPIVIPPFDDKDIICGQGTIALEILEDLPEVDEVLVPLSGGGLISGIALGMKMTEPGIRITGISQMKAAVMIESIRAGHPLEMPEEPTLADSLLGGIGLDNRYTFGIVQKYVDELAQVSEEAIAGGIARILEDHKVVVEGASAVGAAYILEKCGEMGSPAEKAEDPGAADGLPRFRAGSNVVIVVTGRGIPMLQVKEIVNKYF